MLKFDGDGHLGWKQIFFRTNLLKTTSKLFARDEIWHSDLFEYAKFDGDVHFLF